MPELEITQQQSEPVNSQQNVVIQKAPPVAKKRSLLSLISWGESYSSLLLGALVVIVGAVIGFLYVKAHQPKQEILPPATISRAVSATLTVSPVTTSTATPTSEKGHTEGKQNIYVVKKGDNLWTIAEKEYGSGYNWVSISQANKLADPGAIFSGNKLVIPSVTPIFVQNKQMISPTPTVTITLTPSPKPEPVVTKIPGSNAISGSTYAVQKGDNLWNIAVRAYGDGYKWADIAKANNLATPSLVHAGNVLKIPRK